MTPTRILSHDSTCRRCGCSDLNACIIDPQTGDVLTETTLAGIIAEGGFRAVNALDACYWVEPDLCSACVQGGPTAAEVPPLDAGSRGRAP